MSVNENNIIKADDPGSSYQSVINADMFKKFAVARINAAIALMADSNPNEKIIQLRDNIHSIFKESRFKEFEIAFNNKKKQIENLNNEFKKANITREQFQFLCEEAESKYLKSFDEVYTSHIEDLQSIMTILAHEVDPKGTMSSVIKKINRQADTLRAKESRPILENTYTVDNFNVTSRLSPEGELTSEQKEQYKRTFNKDITDDKIHTSPSTIRDIRQIGQANALRTEIKINDELMFTGHRHGSPSVLKINDDALRQYKTIENIKQTMAIAAKEKIEKLFAGGEKRPDTLILDISSMSLLSPVMEGDLVDPMKQYRQVEDTRHAYWSLQGRDIELSIKLDGKEEKIKVQLDSTFMTIGVNAVRGIGTIAAQKLVNRVNNRGIDQFINKFFAHSQRSENTDDPILKNLNNIENSPVIQKCKDSIEKFNGAHRQRMKGIYEILDNLNKRLSKTDIDSRQKTQLNASRANALKLIHRYEKKLDILYSRLAKTRKSVYIKSFKELKKKSENLKKSNNSQIFIDTLDIYFNQPKPGIIRIIKVKLYSRKKDKLLKKIQKSQDPTKVSKLKQAHEDIQTKIDTLNRTNYTIQSRFSVLNANMGGFVEWFCKSGEDRTGLLNEHIEAFCIFTKKYGHPPRWGNDEDLQLFHDIMPHVHNGAPNRTSNGFNDDAPGLKVSDKDFEMPTVSYAIDKKMANIGKKASSIKLSNSIKSAESARQFIEKRTAPELKIKSEQGLNKKEPLEDTKTNNNPSPVLPNVPDTRGQLQSKPNQHLGFGLFQNHKKMSNDKIASKKQTENPEKKVIEILSNDAVVDNSISKDLKAKISYVNNIVKNIKDLGLSLEERIKLSGLVSKERYLRLSRINDKSNPDKVNIIPSQGFNQVYRNSEMYSLALIKGICEEIKFPIAKENLKDFYKLVHEANSEDDSKKCQDALSTLKQKFSKESIPKEFINAILPFYDQFMQDIESLNKQNQQLDPNTVSIATLEAQKEFLGQVCFQLVETPAMQLYPEAPKEGAKLSMEARHLRKELGIMDGIIEALNEHRLTYVPPTLSDDALKCVDSAIRGYSPNPKQKTGLK